MPIFIPIYIIYTSFFSFELYMYAFSVPPNGKLILFTSCEETLFVTNYFVGVLMNGTDVCSNLVVQCLPLPKQR